MPFVLGFAAPFEGFAHLLKRPRLWHYAAIPIVLNVILVAIAIWAWLRYGQPWIESMLPTGDGWLATSGKWIARVLLWIATLPLALGIYLAAASLVGAPFYEVLCKRTEAEVLGLPPPEPRRGFLRAIADGIRVELGNLVVAIVGGTIALLAPLLLPGLGAILSVGIGWFLAGFDFVAYPFDRQALSLSHKMRIATRHLAATLGFGLAVYVLLIPLITLPIVAPCAVVGAAKLFPGGNWRGRARFR